MTTLKSSRVPKAFEGMFGDPWLMNKEMKLDIFFYSSRLPLATGDAATAAQKATTLRHTLGVHSVYVKSIKFIHQQMHCFLNLTKF